jgi:NitT/TauT family transport system substrate-binding protein
VKRSHVLALTGGALVTHGLPAAAQSTTSLRLGTIAVEEAAVVHYAAEKGFFKQQGLDVAPSMFRNGGSVSQAVLAGAIDIGVSNSGSISLAHARGLPLVLVQCAALYSRPSPIAYLVVGGTTGIKSAKDLAGKTIAVSTLRDMLQAATMSWIDANGGDSKAVNFVELPPVAQSPAIAHGRIHGGVLPEPLYTQNKAGFQTLGPVLEAVNNKRAFQTLGVVAGKAWASENEATARRVSLALRSAARWANRNRAECAQLLAAFTKVPLDVIEAYSRIEFAETNSAAYIQPVVDMLARYGILTRGFDAAEVFAPGVM